MIVIEYSTDNENWSETVPGITHVGDQTVYVRATNANYDTKTCEYELSVTCRSITLTSATDGKEYDGDALTNSTVTLTGDGFVEGEGYTTEVTGSQTLVGESENTFTYTLNEGTQAVDYCIETVNGTLTVTSSDDITLVCPSGGDVTKMYDGTALNPAATASGVGSDVIVIEYSTDNENWSETVPSITNVDEQLVYVRATNDNYETKTCQYTLSVTPRPLTIKLTASKHYDGEIMEFDQTVFDGVYPDGVTVTEAEVVNLATGDYLYSGHIETEDSEQGVYTCYQGFFGYVMDRAATQTGFVVKNSAEENVNGNYIPQFQVTLTIVEPDASIECTADNITLADCQPYATVADVQRPALIGGTGDINDYVLTPSVAEGTQLEVGEYQITWTLSTPEGAMLATCEQTVTVDYAPCEDVLYQGHTYPAVRIGSQCWLAENLRNERYDDNINNGGQIANFRPVQDDEANVEAYGYLYSWYSAVGVEEDNNTAMPETQTDECAGEYIQGICPYGWAIPTQADVNALRAAVEDDADRLKDFDPQYWIPGANGSTNLNSGFNAHAGGHYNTALGRFEGILLYAYFWEAESQPNATEVLSAVISYYCDNAFEIFSSKDDLRPVRCVRKTTLAPEE